MTKDVLFPIVRHLLTSVGGAVGANGVLTGQEADVVAGAIVALIGVAWSLAAKYVDRKRAGG